MSLAVLLGIGLVFLYLILRSRNVDMRAPAQVADQVGFDVAVVGESHYQPALTRLCGGKKHDSANCGFVADVVPEDSNPYDSKAMRVDINGQTVGYLSRDAAIVWRSRHGDQGVRCDAVVRGGWKRGRGDEGSFGVWLRLPG